MEFGRSGIYFCIKIGGSVELILYFPPAGGNLERPPLTTDITEDISTDPYKYKMIYGDEHVRRVKFYAVRLIDQLHAGLQDKNIGGRCPDRAAPVSCYVSYPWPGARGSRSREDVAVGMPPKPGMPPVPPCPPSSAAVSAEGLSAIIDPVASSLTL